MSASQKSSAWKRFRTYLTGRLDRDAIGGLLLILASLLALVMANSPLLELYHEILSYDFVIGLRENFTLELSLKHWINDGLMVIFFLVAGLEIKREILVGQLSTWRKAVTPLLAALGGVLVPASIYLVLNAGTPFAQGWGIPMATDIAYAVGIIGLLGKRVPVEAKIFLTALAVADDLAAILVIVFFYSSSIAWGQMLMAAGIFGLLLLLRHRNVQQISWYVLLGLAFWLCFIHSGVHPTIAGVLLSITIPVEAGMATERSYDHIRKQAERLRRANLVEDDPLSNQKQLRALQKIREFATRSHPPLIRLSHALEGFNSYAVLPLFALANAGVSLSVSTDQLFSGNLALGIILGLVIGKVSGIFLFTWVGRLAGLAHLPRNLNLRHILGMGFIAGIGFTMSLFITNLAFSAPQLVQVAKISILSASLLAGLIGVLVLRSNGGKSVL